MKNLKEKQINQICKKHPQWKFLFLSYLYIDENLSIVELEKTFSLIISHKSIFKNLIHEAKSFLELKDNRSVLERLADKVTVDIHNHKKEQFIKSLKSKKYQHLFNEEIEQEIHTILDNKISINSLKHQFFNKLAKYKNSNELLESLQSFKNKNIQWNREYYENLIKENNLNVEILDDQNGYMIIQVNDYEACKELGSQAWCIAQNKDDFFKYTSDYKRQFIVLNFDKPIENNESMIGFTIDINGLISDSYLKNDKSTPKKIKEQFIFSSFSKEKIKNILKEKTNQESFEFICRYGLIDFYDEYINKEDVDPSDNYNQPILLSSVNGHFDVVNRLLEDSRVNPSTDNNYAIRFASENGHFDVVNRLLDDPRVNPSAAKNYSIRLASKNGHLDIVNRLLEDTRVDPSDINNDAIILASLNGHLDIVNRLLEDTRVDPSDKNNQAIRWASLYGHLDVVNRLLEDPRVDPSANNDQAIRYSLMYKEYDVVNILSKDPRVNSEAKNNFLIRWIFKEDRDPYNVIICFLFIMISFFVLLVGFVLFP